MRTALPVRAAVLTVVVALLAVWPSAQGTAPATSAAQARAAVSPQPETAATGAKIARVERGLLPGILIAGRPAATGAIADRMAALKVPGVSVAVINDGAIEWARGYGVAETGSSTPVTPNTLFQAASISKPVAAMAAMRLVQQGLLSLDEDVNAKLKTWKVPENDFTAKEKVTLRRLLSHTAGLTVSGFPGYAADAAVPSVVQILDGEKPANTGPIRVDVLPGSLWRYAGGGFTVMQLLLADVTGRPFPDLLAEMVLKPIGMKDSTYEQPLPDARRDAAAAAHRADGTLIPGRFHTYPEMAAAGLWTTPTDLARFLLEMQKALRGESALLTADTARRMLTVERDGYGLGFGLQGAGAAGTFGHGGSNAGFKCQMVAFRESGRGAVVMTNGDQGSRLAQEVLRAISAEYGWPIFKPRTRTTVTVTPEMLAPLTGRYLMRPGRVITISLEGGTLIITDRDQRIELYPESETRFFEVVEETTVEFVKDADGKVTHLTIDGRIKAPRVGEAEPRPQGRG